MYKRIFKGSYIPHTVESTEEAIRNAILDSKRISFMDFDSEEDSKRFAEKFPKYVKVKPCIMSGVDAIYYMADFRVSSLNDVTGEVNETGLKRLDGLIKTLKREGYIK